MSLWRSRKIAPTSPIAAEDGYSDEGERELGEGRSKESIINIDDQTPSVDQHAKPSQDGTTELRPKTGRRFMRYRNSWVGEDGVALNLQCLRRVHARLDARFKIAEDDEDASMLSLLLLLLLIFNKHQGGGIGNHQVSFYGNNCTL